MEWWSWLILIVVLAFLAGAVWWWQSRASRTTQVDRLTGPRTTRLAEFIDRPIGTATVERQAATHADDLADIEGIGPRIHDVLNEAGIRTFAQLAATSVERLEEIIQDAELRLPPNPSTWPEQARLAAEGRWDELKQLQDSLKGGVAG